MSSNNHVIADLWASYNRVLPSSASATQVIETRRAFYAGAFALLKALDKILEPGLETTEKDIDSLESIHKELQEFVKSVEAGHN